jgi:large subunit ribosomal protein L7Ae
MAPKTAKPKPKAKPAAKKAAPEKKVEKKAAPASSEKKKSKKTEKKSSRPSDAKRGKAPVRPDQKKLDSKKGKGKQRQVSKYAALFVPRPNDFSIGQDIPPKRDLTRYVRWPKYIKRQRQKVVLMRRLKVPPAVNQFRYCLDAVSKKPLFRLAHKYAPESKLARKQRLKQLAEAKLKDPKTPDPPRRVQIQFGIRPVTRVVQRKQAKLVVIANNVDPLELVIWLPALCKKLEIPYCVVKDKASLGRLVHRKTCSCIAFTDITSEDKAKFQKILDAVKTKYAEKYEQGRKHWGGQFLGVKHDLKMKKRSAAAVAAAGGRVEAAVKKAKKTVATS